jgi:hypothetical protein
VNFQQTSLAHNILMGDPTFSTMFKNVSLQQQMKMDTAEASSQSDDVSLSSFDSRESSVESISQAAPKHPLPTQFRSEVGCSVLISAHEKGAKEFHVRLHNTLQDYQNLKLKLHDIRGSLSVVDEPVLNKMYAAILTTDDLERVEIVEFFDNYLCLVNLIDSGIKRVINVCQIRQLPSDRELNAPPFAWKFSLTGVQDVRHLTQSELFFYFFYLTRDKKLSLHLDEISLSKGEKLSL